MVSWNIVESEVSYRGHTIVPHPTQRRDGRWSISFDLIRTVSGRSMKESYHAESAAVYILEIEAYHECISTAKNLIKRNLAGI